MTERERIIENMSRAELREYLLTGGTVPIACKEALLVANEIREECLVLVMDRDGTYTDIIHERATKSALLPACQGVNSTPQVLGELDMRCKEYTFRRNVSGPVISTIRVTFDENIKALRGANDSAESLEMDVLAAVGCIAGENATIVHCREFEEPSKRS